MSALRLRALGVVGGLLLGKGREFTSIGDATLKGFDEPVTLYEVGG